MNDEKIENMPKYSGAWFLGTGEDYPMARLCSRLLTKSTVHAS